MALIFSNSEDKMYHLEISSYLGKVKKVKSIPSHFFFKLCLVNIYFYLLWTNFAWFKQCVGDWKSMGFSLIRHQICINPEKEHKTNLSLTLFSFLLPNWTFQDQVFIGPGELKNIPLNVGSSNFLSSPTSLPISSYLARQWSQLHSIL